MARVDVDLPTSEALGQTRTQIGVVRMRRGAGGDGQGCEGEVLEGGPLAAKRR